MWEKFAQKNCFKNAHHCCHRFHILLHLMLFGIVVECLGLSFLPRCSTIIQKNNNIHTFAFSSFGYLSFNVLYRGVMSYFFVIFCYLFQFKLQLW